MTSAACPGGHETDAEWTAFGLCMDATADSAWTPRGRADAGARPDPTRPFPSLADRTAGVGLPPSLGASFLPSLTSELFQLLDSGVASVSDMANGRPWPRPRIEGIRQLVETYDEETCRLAATEAREIVQSQDRAPNVTSLFAKKCADVEAERLSRREELRRALA